MINSPEAPPSADGRAPQPLPKTWPPITRFSPKISAGAPVALYLRPILPLHLFPLGRCVGPIDEAGAALQRLQQSGPLWMLTIDWLLIDPHQMQTDDSRSRDPPSSGCSGPPFSVGSKSPITFITTSLEIITPFHHAVHCVFWPLSSADVFTSLIRRPREFMQISFQFGAELAVDAAGK